MSAANTILERLEGVKATGKGRWMACCPAHADSSPSLSIRETEDGRVLLYDFAGCETQAVLDALGLGLSDLFDVPLGHHFDPIRGGFTARELLDSIAHETLVALLIIGEAQKWEPTTGLARLQRAEAIIAKARELAYVG